MDKQMIEKMASVMLENTLNTYSANTAYETSRLRESFYTTFVTYAEHLYNAGCRILTENAVVLTKEEKGKLLHEMYEQGRFDALADIENEGKMVVPKEEYYELKQAKTLLEFREETIKYLEDANIRYAEALENKGKETAEKFAERLKEHFAKTSACYMDSDDTFIPTQTVDEIYGTINEIYKEITEGKV